MPDAFMEHEHVWVDAVQSTTGMPYQYCGRYGCGKRREHRHVWVTSAASLLGDAVEMECRAPGCLVTRPLTNKTRLRKKTETWEWAWRCDQRSCFVGLRMCDTQEMAEAFVRHHEADTSTHTPRHLVAVMHRRSAGPWEVAP